MSVACPSQRVRRRQGGRLRGQRGKALTPMVLIPSKEWDAQEQPKQRKVALKLLPTLVSEGRIWAP